MNKFCLSVIGILVTICCLAADNVVVDNIRYTLQKNNTLSCAAANKDALVDVSGMTFDNTLPKEQRAANMLAVMKNPYCFRHGDMVTKLEFADDGPPLQDLLTSFFLRMKSGL